MRSFAFALIAAATFATFGSAAPVASVDAPALPGVPAVVPAPVGGVVNGVESKVSGMQARDGVPSLAVIYGTLKTDIDIYIGQLNALDVNTCTAAEVTAIVADIDAKVVAVVPELKALIGLGPSVILAPVVGDVVLTVADVAAIVDVEVEALLSAVAHVVAVVDVKVKADVETALFALDAVLAPLLSVTFGLVAGVDAIVESALVSVDAIVATLRWVQVAAVLGIHL